MWTDVEGCIYLGGIGGRGKELWVPGVDTMDAELARFSC